VNRLAATLGLVVAIAVVIAIVLGTRSPTASGDHGSHNTASGSTTVQRRDLVQTDTESGTLSYADSRTVYDGLSGTITWLPAVGQVIKPGQALYRVGGVPVILMNGSTPAYRDLKSSDSDGPDILELNRNLVALGFNPDGIVVDDVWQPATTAGVELFQESLGESETGDLKLGNIVFLPHNRVISAVDTSLGSSGSSSGGSGNGSATAGQPATGPEFVSLTSTAPGSTGTGTTPAPGKPGKKKKKKKPITVAALLALLKAQSAQLQAESAQLRAAQSGAQGANNSNNGSNNKGAGGASNGGGSNNSNGGGASNGGGGGGSGSGSGAAVLETSSTKLVATVNLDATKQSEAKVGEPVTVEMPGGSTVNGKVIAVSPIAQSSSNSGNGNSGNGGGGGGGSGNGNGNGNGNGSSGATIPVTIGLSGRTSGAGLDQAAVSVSFAQAEAKGVLSVPVTALLAVAGGNYAVQQAASPHTLIPVITGLFAAGYVQISGQGIYPGLAVTDSQG
jgi:hypothetical protein